MSSKTTPDGQFHTKHPKRLARLLFGLRDKHRRRRKHGDGSK